MRIGDRLFKPSFAQTSCIASLIDLIEGSCGTTNSVLLWERRTSNNPRDAGRKTAGGMRISRDQSLTTRYPTFSPFSNNGKEKRTS